jgi:hypothetical protein
VLVKVYIAQDEDTSGLSRGKIDQVQRRISTWMSFGERERGATPVTRWGLGAGGRGVGG